MRNFISLSDGRLQEAYAVQISARWDIRMETVWYVRYSIGSSEDNGMIVSQDGEIVGADRANTFRGTYNVDGTHVSADVCITSSRVPGKISSPSESVKLTLVGSMNENSALLHGHLNHRPEIEVTVELQRAVQK
jgi:hypothetical protein